MGNMIQPALQLAIRHLAEAKALLEEVVTSSESFDYHAAKKALRELDFKIRELGQATVRLAEAEPAEPITPMRHESDGQGVARQVLLNPSFGRTRE
jgi:hypothetical protein